MAGPVTLDDNEVPSTGDDNDASGLGTFTWLKGQVTRGQRSRKYFRDEAQRAFDFVANHQWEDDDVQKLESENRPIVSFNRVAPIVEAVCGLEVNNRQSVIYLPRTEGQVEQGVNEGITDVSKWMRDECGAEDEESNAFRNMTICGEGWTESRMDFDLDPKGQFVKESIYPLEMGVFHGASRPNYSDARGVYRIRDMDPDDASDLFQGKFTPQQMHASWLEPMTTPADGGVGNKQDYPDQTRSTLEREQSDAKNVRMVQVQWWQREAVHMVAQQGDPAGIVHMNDQEFNTYKTRVSAMQQADAANGTNIAPVYEHVTSNRRVFYEAFVGAQVLSIEKMTMQEFRFKAMTAKRDHKNKCFYGMVRDMFDPQMWANKWISQIMNILNSNAKGGIMAESDAFLDWSKAEQDWADPTKIVKVKPGSLEKQKIKERPASQLPPELSLLLNFALSALRDTTGVNLELLGQADREQAASLEAQRRQSAMTILASMFDNLRRYRKSDGRLMLHFIQMLPQGTLYRVLADDATAQYVKFMGMKDIECYDVIIDEAPTSPDQKIMVWNLTTQLLSQGIPFSPPTIIALLKYSPYPASVVNEISQSMGLNGQMSPQMTQMRLQQAEQALKVLEQRLIQAQQVAKTAADESAINLLKLEIEEYKAQTARIAAELNYAGLIKEQASQLQAGIIDQLAPPISSAEGGPAGGPDILQQLMAKMDTIQQVVQQLSQPPQQPPMDPNTPPAQPQPAAPQPQPAQ